MRTSLRIAGTVLAVLTVLAAVSCTPAAITHSAAQVAEAAKGLKALVPAIEAGLSLAKPDSPTARALTPSAITGWPYGTQTPAEVYAAVGGTTGTVRVPATGYYQDSATNQLYFTLTPESALGAGYYRLVLTTYPAFDLTVAYTIEEYVVNAAGSESWAWGNLDLSKARDKWISLTTIYTDGSTGARTLQWSSGTTGQYYSAFAVGTPDPATASTFDGYRYSDFTAPAHDATTGNYSSSATEHVTGKGTVVDAAQFYTESTATQHSGVTTVIKDKKRHWSVPEYIVTRMQEDTTAGSKTIRSVGDLGPGTSYYIDKVDIALVGGMVTYTSTHDVYSGAVPRSAATAADYVDIALTEDAAGAGTFSGTMEETQGTQKLVHGVTVRRDNHYRLSVNLTLTSTAPRGLADTVSIPITRQDISSLSIALPDVSGTFDGYYEAGSLFGTVSAGGKLYDVVVSNQGVAVDDVLY